MSLDRSRAAGYSDTVLVDMESAGKGCLRAVFRLGGRMRAQLDISVSSQSVQALEALYQVSRFIEDSRYARRSSCPECDWHEFMGLVKRCHDEVRTLTPYASLALRIEDERVAGESERAELVAAASGPRFSVC